MKLKKLITIIIATGLLGIAGIATYLVVVTSNLPNIITVNDYEPLVVSQVYDRKGQKIGEFFREKRILVPYEQIPKHVIHAFISAEDDSFFDHGGINYQAILRAFVANIKAGRKVQGGSTITQQVARSLLLSREKTYSRKIKEIILSYRMENNLKKEEILWLYLNQIYLGQGSYGVEAASRIYFRKPLAEVTIAEAALLAGLPQAPSRYSPIYNPTAAKNRQRYVLKRMAEEGYVSEEIANAEMEKPLQIFVRKDYKELAPFYLETVRQLLIKHIGEVEVLDKGIKVFTGLDLEKQLEAKRQIEQGLRELDKRQGFRGPEKNLQEAEEIAKLLLETRNELLDNISPLRTLQPDGTLPDKGPLNLTGKDDKGEPLPNVPDYIKMDDVIKGVVTNVDDKWGLVTVRFAESRGLIDIETMEWARKPNPEVRLEWDKIKKPSQALAKGDVIQVRVVGKKFRSSRLGKELRELQQKMSKKYERPEELPVFDDFANLELEQDPIAEAALVSIDQDSQDIIAMVGGRDFNQSQFNRAYQAARQTGSSFKSLVYAAALDKGYSPATPIIDAPIVFEEEDKESSEEAEGQEEIQTKRWKPMNHSNKFIGDILFRNALIRSLNVPTVKIIEKIGIDWVAKYARRLGIFSPLNMDFTLALGSSGVTLYEMTKVFSEFGRLGKRVRPIIIHKVESAQGEVLLEQLSLDDRFEQEISALDEEFEQKRQAYLAYKKAHPELVDSHQQNREASSQEVAEEKNNEPAAAETTSETSIGMTAKEFTNEPPLYFSNPDQLIKPTTAYIITSLLQGVVEEPRGTGQRARALGRPVAGKTGTTNGYYDGWFVGFTADIATGVWVGFDQEKTLGRGEVGGKAALPIWLEYMKFAHEGLPISNFKIPEGIVFANIDNETGKLATAKSDQVVRQAFVEGSEPSEFSSEQDSKDDKDFYKEELSE
ncbi:MAG: PBP1A family penicillin-binding protein [Bdellovibrionales bacterium]|nr:PBP1A family penicillin-binding protein [Bdellovibrionales bacterium]